MLHKYIFTVNYFSLHLVKQNTNTMKLLARTLAIFSAASLIIYLVLLIPKYYIFWAMGVLVLFMWSLIIAMAFDSSDNTDDHAH